MLGLIKNESIKIYNKKLTWILLLLTIIVTIITFGIYKLDDTNIISGEDEIEQEIQLYEERLKISELNPTLRKDAENKLRIAKYRQENDISNTPTTAWTAMLKFSGLVEMIMVFIIVIAADIVAGEYSSGTMKLLLIRPHSRSTILFSKYIAVTLVGLVMLVLLLVSAYFTNLLLFGTGGADVTDLFINQQSLIVQKNVMIQVIKLYGLSVFPILSYITLAFTISTILKNSTLAVGISLVTMIIGNSMVEATAKIKWLKYLPFANSDMTRYIFHLQVRPEMTMMFSISILLAYICILILISWRIFTRRDVSV